MSKYLSLWIFLFLAGTVKAQEAITRILISGIEDAHTFSEDYLRPGTEAAMYQLSNAWYQSAEVKSPLRFEFSIIGTGVMNLEKHQTFFLDPTDYRNLEFPDQGPGREVSTIFGHMDPAVRVQTNYQLPSGIQTSTEFALPQGVGKEGVNFFPLAFLQARLGIFKGTEIKARYFPKVNYEDVSAGLYGGALQHEFTSWIPGADLLPIAVAGLVGYTYLEGEFDFTEREYIKGSNQILSSEMESWTFAAILSTKIPVFNLYGGIGYATGSSTSRMRGEYIVTDADSGTTLFTLVDPVSVDHEIGGMIGSLGLSIQLGILKLHADYNFQEYNSITAGVHVGI